MAIVSDSFNRANSNTGLGITDTGQTWDTSVTNSLGTWGISNNQAYQVTSTSGGIALIDSGIVDVDVSVDLTWGNNGGISFRGIGNKDYYLLRLTSSAIQLYSLISGSATLLGSYSTTPTSGQLYTLRATANGNSIQCYLNGTSVIGPITNADHQGTFQGLRQNNATSDRYDNFTVSNLSTSTGTPVTYTYDTKQSIYANIQSNYDTKQSIYSNQSTNFDTKQSIYKSINQPYDMKQAIYKAIQELFDTEQVFTQAYTQVFYTYDMKIQQYKDIQIPVDTKQAYYSDISVDLDTKQVIYKQIHNLYDTLIQIRNKHDETLYGTLTIQRVIEHRLTINKRHSEDLQIERVLNHILRV